MTDEERFVLNKEFAKSVESVIMPYMNGNPTAAKRAAGSCVFTLERKQEKPTYKVRMLTSRGKPTIPVDGCKWTRTGDSVVSTNKTSLQFLLALFDIRWSDFLSAFPFPARGIRQIELKDAVSKLSPVIKE